MCYIHAMHQVGPSIRSLGSKFRQFCSSSEWLNPICIKAMADLRKYESIQTRWWSTIKTFAMPAWICERSWFPSQVVHMVGPPGASLGQINLNCMSNHIEICFGRPTTSEHLQQSFRWNFKWMHIGRIFRSFNPPIICWNSYKHVQPFIQLLEIQIPS